MPRSLPRRRAMAAARQHVDPSGFFGQGMSSAPKIPTSRRFRDSSFLGDSTPCSTPGPGSYDAPNRQFSRGVAIPRAARGSSGTKRDKIEDTPGPAAYETKTSTFGNTRGVCTMSRASRQPLHAAKDTDAVGPGSYEAANPSRVTSAAARGSGAASFGRAARRPLHSGAAVDGVGPGSYEPAESLTSTKRRVSGPATIGRAPRPREKFNAAPGPGAYESVHIDATRTRSVPAARGGTFSRSARSGLWGPPGCASPGVGSYSSGAAASGSKGGTIGRSAKGGSIRPVAADSPGPGSYTPMYSASSRVRR